MFSIRPSIPALLLITALVFPDLLPAQEQAGITENRGDFHLFLLIGQSNMAGRGEVEAQDQIPDKRILMFDMNNKWVPAVDPLHFDKPGIAGVGLGRTFARDYIAHYPGITVGLIPCAVGGSAIAAWEPGGYHSQTKTHPYDDAMARAKLALESGTLRGILWHQGESDSKPDLADVYEARLHALIARLRAELSAPDAPFIAGQMGRFSERTWSDAKTKVDVAQQNLPQKVARTAFVRSDGLSHKGDKVHFSSAAYRELGHRYYQAYRQLTLAREPNELNYELERIVVRQGFDGKMGWTHARAGAIPASSLGDEAKNPLVVMTTQQLLLSRSDVFYGLHSTWTSDLGQHWSDLLPQETFARQKMADGREMTVCDFTPAWHAQTGTLLGTGQTVWYENNQVMRVRPRATAYATYDPQTKTWSAWSRLIMPNETRFQHAGAGSVQRYDLPNGDILLPIYYKVPEQQQHSATVCRCSFDGRRLKYVEHGNEMTVDVQRGLCEPSITRYGGRFYLTLRNDERGYVTVSDDGLNYEPIQVWRFDDGEDLGSYNTQQHWVTHRDGLFLAYTRRGANNDHVFRNRAPLFIARVNPERLCVLRDTEQILVPERGARLGNFGVTHVSPQESWVTVTEWMQPVGVEERGSDNRIIVVRVKWSQLNG